MVELKFNVKKKDIQVFYEDINRFDAETKVEGQKSKAFGFFSNVMKVFDKKKGDIRITDHFKRFEPFWVVKGESYFEYLRQTDYQFEVKPEVISVKVGNLKCDAGDDALCTFSGEDHCVERFEEEVLKNAYSERDKGLDKYLKFTKTKSLVEIEDLQGEKSFVHPVNYRASFLVRDLMKRLMKPFHADKVLKERVEITKLTLYFRPVHVFQLTDSNGKVKFLEVDGLTGEVNKAESQLFKGMKEMVFNEGTLFELGAEVASMVIPGAAVGAIIGKTIHNRKKKQKTLAKLKETKKAYANEGSKKKKGGRTKLKLR